MPGYEETYVNDFTGTTIGAGWNVYSGVPGGDPGAQWGVSHVVVANGLLQLNTWQDPAYGGKWVAGGLCQCGAAQTYGAYFVRSRVTGAGPTMVELLWPTSGWPPEIDFSETSGGISSSLATLHFTSANSQIHSTVNVDLTQWHTWGVIWTPTSVTYTLDGRIWGQVNIPADIPQQPMTLDLQQQTWCGATPSNACDTSAQSMQVDWVAEYKSVGSSATTSATTSTTTSTTTTADSSRTTRIFTVRPFATNSDSLSPLLRRHIATLASQIKANNDLKVVLAGYSNSASTNATSQIISRARALAVDRYLRQLLINLHVRGVQISVSGASTQPPDAATTTSAAPAITGGVLARIY